MKISNYINKKFSKELQLAIKLCKSSNEIIDESEIIQLMINPFDWNMFVKICEWHRIVPHISKHINEKPYNFPKNIISYFEKAQKENVMKALNITNELIRVSNILEENGIEVFSIKGAVEAQQLYGDINGRSYRDIDLLIPSSKVEEAHNILIKNNYRRTEPNIGLSDKQKKYNINRTHEYAYKQKESGIQLEIHWRLFTNRHLLNIDSDNIKDKSQDIFIDKIKLRTLSIENNIIYLACHGSIHVWFRLFWIKDFAFIISDKNIDWEKIFYSMKEQSMHKILIQAALLSNVLFNTKIPEIIEKNIKSRSLSLLEMPFYAIKSSLNFYNNTGIIKLRILFYQMSLKNSLLYKINCLLPFATHYQDWRMIKLPDNLFFLYFPLRPFLWILRRAF